MPDPYLFAIIDRIERGGEPISVSFVLNSGAVVSGFVRQSQFFASVTRHDAALAADRSRKSRKSKAASPIAAAVESRAETVEAVLGKPEDDSGDFDFVTLSNVRMVWSNGDGLELKTVRLGLDAIAAWWVMPGLPIKGTKDTAGFVAVGVEF